MAVSDIVDWHNDNGAIARKDLIGINAILFLNKTNIKAATSGDVDQKIDIAMRFWEEINQIEGFGKPGAKLKTVTAQPGRSESARKAVVRFFLGKK